MLAISDFSDFPSKSLEDCKYLFTRRRRAATTGESGGETGGIRLPDVILVTFHVTMPGPGYSTALHPASHPN